MQVDRHPPMSGAIFPTHVGFLQQVVPYCHVKLSEIRHTWSLPLADVGFFTTNFPTLLSDANNPTLPNALQFIRYVGWSYPTSHVHLLQPIRHNVGRKTSDDQLEKLNWKSRVGCKISDIIFRRTSTTACHLRTLMACWTIPQQTRGEQGFLISHSYVVAGSRIPAFLCESVGLPIVTSHTWWLAPLATWVVHTVQKFHFTGLSFTQLPFPHCVTASRETWQGFTTTYGRFVGNSSWVTTAASVMSWSPICERLHYITAAAVITRDKFPNKRPEVVGSSKTLPSFTTGRKTMRKRQLGKGEA